MSGTYSLFALTPEEQESFQDDIQDLISQIHAILYPEHSQPLSVYDWSEALRLVRDAFVLANNMHECDNKPPTITTFSLPISPSFPTFSRTPTSPSYAYFFSLSPTSSCHPSPRPDIDSSPETCDTHAQLATLFLAKGDCLHGLGRPREARDAYQAALAASETAYAPATQRLAALDGAVLDDTRARRMGGLWGGAVVGSGSGSGSNCMGAEGEKKGKEGEEEAMSTTPDLGVLGYDTELWDPEPVLQVQCAERSVVLVKGSPGRHSPMQAVVGRYVKTDAASPLWGGRAQHRQQQQQFSGASSPRMVNVSA
jgi:hypothetical protein